MAAIRRADSTVPFVESWPEPIRSGLPSVTPFPLHVFPKFIQRFIKVAAASIGCPIYFVAVPVLAAFGSDVIDLAPELDDFSDTAAVVTALDLVISVDTSVVHLTGAMGLPAWVLLPYAKDWRWLRDREDSPWYPSLRLFRQKQPQAWDGVLTRVAAELGRLARMTAR